MSKKKQKYEYLVKEFGKEFLVQDVMNISENSSVAWYVKVMEPRSGADVPYSIDAGLSVSDCHRSVQIGFDAYGHGDNQELRAADRQARIQKANILLKHVKALRDALVEADKAIIKAEK